MTERGGYIHHPADALRGPLDAVLPHEETGWELHLVFTDDGAYLPSFMRRPEGSGSRWSSACTRTRVASGCRT
jgi:hypothetical protein